MNKKTIFNIKLSCLCCPDKILLNSQISKNHILEEIVILELKFGTKRKNRRLVRSLGPRGMNQIMVGTDRRHVL